MRYLVHGGSREHATGMDFTYHGTNVVWPGVVPVGSDSLTSRDRSSQLEGTRGTIVVAGESGVSRVSDRVAEWQS